MDEINNIYAIADSNLGTVLLSDFGNDGLFLSSDDNAISSMEGTLCFDESTNEYVLVNMVPTSTNSSDSFTFSPSFLPAFNNGSSSLGDLSLFQDGGQVMLLNNGSLLASNDDNLDPAISDFFGLDHVLNTNVLDKSSIALSKSPDDQSTGSTQLSKSEFLNTPKKLTSATIEDRTTPLMSQNHFDLLDERDEYDKKHYCKLCNVKFSTMKEFKAHWTSHKEKNHKCNVCESSFNKIKNLILHEALHKVNITTCPLDSCRKEFKRFASLKAHLKTHEEEETLTCTKCGEEFTNQLYLELHCKHHPQCKTVNGEKSQAASTVFDCKLCHREFDDVCAFNAHKKEHEKIKKALAPKRNKKKTFNGAPASRMNRCKVCPKWFYKPSQLIRHMRIHTGERPFECTECHKAFNQANSLKIHMLKHTGVRPYQCQFCSTAFSQRGNLRQHIHRVHSIPKIEEKVFKCGECSCIFKKLCSLNAHKNRVHQKRCQTVANVEADDTSNTITIENGFDDIEDEDFDVLLEKKSFVNTITISLGCDSGEAAQQQVFVNKRGNVRYYRCSHCPKRSTTLKDIIRHLKTNILGKPFKCQFCTTKFSQHSAYLTHLTLHASAPKYCCDICRKTFSNPAELKMHSIIHGQYNDNQLCMLCLKTYPNAEMGTHQCTSLFQSTDFTSQPANIETLTVQKTQSDKINLVLPPYVCNQCDLVFESYLRLKGHLRSHDANICEICNFLFPTKDKLREHSATVHAQSKNSGGTESGAVKRKRSVVRTKTNSKECQLTGSSGKSEKKSHGKVTRPEENIDEGNAKKSEKVAPDDKIGDANMELANVDVNLNQLDENMLALNNDPSNFIVSELCNNDLADSINEPVNETVVETLQTDTNDKNLSSELLSIDSLECWFDNIPSNGVTILESETDSLSLSSNLTGAVIYRCTKCMQQYSTEIELQKHFEESVACNNGISNVASNFFYACNTCYLTFQSLPSFLRHLQTHEGLKMFSCHFCGEQNKTQVELTQHIAQHALNNEYPCIHCGELCASADSVKQHIVDIHLMSSADVKKNDTKRRKNAGNDLLLSEKEKIALAGQKPTKYSSISEKVLSSLLKNGIDKGACARNDTNPNGSTNESKTAVKKSVHAKENTCDYCGRGFKKLCDLKRHLRTHTGEKPFKCDYCNKCFRVKSILNCHLKTHFTVNNIFCHVCNRFFATVGSLKIHMRLHTGDRPYKCLFCKETFRTSGHRDSHHRKHTNTKKEETETATDSIMLDRLGLNLGDGEEDDNFLLSDIATTDDFKFQELDDLGELQNIRLIRSGSLGQKSALDLDTNIGDSRQRKSIMCDRCDKSFASIKTLKTHMMRHHQQSLSLPSIQDENEPESIMRNGKEIDDKWIVQDDLGFISLVGKHSMSKKPPDTIADDFYVMDKQLDLNCMIPDIFSE